MGRKRRKCKEYLKDGKDMKRKCKGYLKDGKDMEGNIGNDNVKV